MKKSYIKLRYLFCAIILSAIAVYCLRSYLIFPALKGQYSFSGSSFYGEGYSGLDYVIDEGKKRLLCLDDEGRLTDWYEGGLEEGPFYYGFNVCDDPEGNIYLSDVVYGQRGGKLDYEHVYLLEDGTKTSRPVYTYDFTEDEAAPFGYGNITELKYDGERVYFLVKGQGSISRYVIEGGNSRLEEKIVCEADIQDAAYDVTTGKYCITTRQGEVRLYEEGKGFRSLELGNDESIPVELTCLGGRVYICDTLDGTVWMGELTGDGRDCSVFCRDGNFYSYISGRNDSGQLYLSDGSSCFKMDIKSAESSEISEIPITFRWKIILSWLSLLFLELHIFAFLVYLITMAVSAFLKIEDKAGVLRIALVGFASLAVAAVISYTSLNQLSENMVESTISGLNYTVETLENTISAERINRVASSKRNYGGEDFRVLKKAVDSIGDASYEQGLYYYIVLMALDDEGARVAVDYENTYACNQRVYEYGDNDTTNAMETGETIINRGDISAFGSWICVTKPVRDEDGRVTAAIEVGTSADQLNLRVKQFFRETLFSVLSVTVVVIMLIMEIIFAINFYEKKKGLSAGERDSTNSIPIRLTVFAIYLTDCMQDAFIALLCERLCRASDSGLLQCIPEGIAIALPISGQLLFAAIASLIGGRYVSRLGSKKTMTAGLLIQLSGLLICGIFGNAYIAIMLGKLFIGFGEGMVYVTANTMAALTENNDNSQKAFADVSAGVLSGVSVGAGMGSIILSMGSFNMVYFAGAVFIFLTLLLALSGESFGRVEEKKTGNQSRKVREAEGESAGKSIDFGGFFLSRRVFAFFIFGLLPFMISLSYRDYFFPLFAGDMGVSEVRIGQIYLLCGVMTLYVGPVISGYLLERIGARKAVALAGFLMMVVMLLYVIRPEFPVVLAAVIIFSYIISFAYTCQYSFFELLPEVVRYGEGPAMGVYSMFEAIGQTAGPVIFGILLSYGRRNGLLIGAAAMLVFTLLFLILSIGYERNTNEKK